jgi:hypothetical protein
MVVKYRHRSSSPPTQSNTGQTTGRIVVKHLGSPPTPSAVADAGAAIREPPLRLSERRRWCMCGEPGRAVAGAVSCLKIGARASFAFPAVFLSAGAFDQFNIGAPTHWPALLDGYRVSPASYFSNRCSTGV